MTLAPGTRIGPYEIVGPLGAGGMGEVYRARDTRLSRDVAIKILPADLVHDPERRARFEREAQAVSALNHPNIVTLYESGTSDVGPYLVLERVEGESLRSVLDAGPGPIKRLLDLGSQIAAGLAKAHAAGIVHRDLKPDNVMVTADGFAKILDFGLARLTLPDDGLGAAADTATFVKETESGLILGTLGYLSPEQAAGKPADFRADQFAFGALLYEMATGVRPFKRATLAESLTATIREEPEPVRSKRADLPAPLAWLIERCLAKSPDDRYASTKDLARDLAELRDRLSEISKGPMVDTSGARPIARSPVLRWTAALAAIAAVVAGTFVVARRTAPQVIPSYQQLTFRREAVTGARFSPGGRRVYYSAEYGDGLSKVYQTQLDSPVSTLVGIPNGVLLGVSSKGVLALLETDRRDTYNAFGTLATVPAIGGSPHEIAADIRLAEWMADGERLIVIDAKGKCQIYNAKVMADCQGGSFLRASPKNDEVAYAGQLAGENAVVIQAPDGKQVAALPMHFIYGLAWTPDGQEVWFTGSETGSPNDRVLYALSRDGRHRLITRVPGAMTIYDIAQDGSALISTGAGWFGINASNDNGEERPLEIAGRTRLAGLSHDGKWALLDEQRETGRGAYLASTDGIGLVPLNTKDVARGLTPDWKFMLVQPPPDDAFRLTLLPTGAGEAREVPVPGFKGARPDALAQWSVDGSRMFVQMDRADAPNVWRVYVREENGSWRPVTPEGPSAKGFAVSPDGKKVAAMSGFVVRILSADDGRVLRQLNGETGYPVKFSDDGQRLLLRAPGLYPARLYHRDLTTDRIEPWRTVAPADPTGVTTIDQVLVSHDERSFVYQYTRGLNDLYLMRNLR